MKQNHRLVSMTRTFPGVCRVRVYEALEQEPRKISDHVFDMWPDGESVAALLHDPNGFIDGLEAA
jgi:hypothetical protein